MAIKTEIDRINQAKEDLKNSINAKLTDTQITNETIDEYANFVDSINLGTTEIWKFTMEDGSIVNKEVVIK